MDQVFGGGLSGAASGAAIGSMFGGPGLGTAIGAGVGLLGGWLKKRGSDKRKDSLIRARAEMEKLAREQRAQRMADMERALGYFAPVQQEITRLYG